MRLVRPWDDDWDNGRFYREVCDAMDTAGIGKGEAFELTKVGAESPTPTPGAIKTPGEDAMAPFSKDSDTSRYAALANYPKSGSTRERVFIAISNMPRTRDELARDMNLPDSTIDGRCWELKRGGFIRERETTRKTRAGKSAHVLELTPKGILARPKRPAE